MSSRLRTQQFCKTQPSNPQLEKKYSKCLEKFFHFFTPLKIISLHFLKPLCGQLRYKVSFFAFFFAMTVVSAVFAQQKDVIVTAEPDQYASHLEPIEVQITVTHDQNEKIDEKSFKMDEKPLEVDFVKKVKFSEHSNLMISIYSFTLPPQKKGLQYLSPVTVNVGGKSYHSNETTYQVGK